MGSAVEDGCAKKGLALKRSTLAFAFVVGALITFFGWRSSVSSSHNSGQRFVLVANASQIRPDIPADAVAMDTKTGELCWTMRGAFTMGDINMELCEILAKE